MSVPLRDFSGLDLASRKWLEEAHAKLTTLAAVLDWGRTQRPPVAPFRFPSP